MNIFYLDDNPVKAAQAHCDKHVVKMILETAQLLSTAHRVLDPGKSWMDTAGFYKVTHVNHPCAVWVRSSKTAYLWAACLGMALCREYEKRYKKKHATEVLMNRLYALTPAGIQDVFYTAPPKCVPDDLRELPIIQAYRQYYMRDKRDFARWNYSIPPAWWKV